MSRLKALPLRNHGKEHFPDLAHHLQVVRTNFLTSFPSQKDLACKITVRWKIGLQGSQGGLLHYCVETASDWTDSLGGFASSLLPIAQHHKATALES